MCGHMVDRVVTGQDSAVTIQRELLKDGNYAVKDRQSCQRTSMVMLHGGQSGKGAVTSGQSCHRKGLFCHMANRVHMTGLVLSHGEQSCNRTGWCCHMSDRVVTGREWYLAERSGHRTSLVVILVTDRVPQDREWSFHVTEELSQDGNVNVGWGTEL
jgi:hypothetical protein